LQRTVLIISHNKNYYNTFLQKLWITQNKIQTKKILQKNILKNFFSKLFSFEASGGITPTYVPM